MNIDSDIIINVINTHETFTARVKDLSATGLQFHTSHELNEGQKLNVNIEPGKTGITLPFHALVEVVHIEEIIADKEYNVGCQIKEMLPVSV